MYFDKLLNIQIQRIARNYTELQNINLPRSPHLYLHLSRANPPMPMRPTNDTHKSFCLVQEEVVEFSVKKFFNMPSTSSHPKCSAASKKVNSVIALLTYSSHGIGNYVQQSTTRPDQEEQFPTI